MNYLSALWQYSGNFYYQFANYSYLVIYFSKPNPMKLIKKKDAKVLNKKIEGDRVYYLLAKNRTKKWMDFEHLDDYLQAVMEYQRLQQQKNQLKLQEAKISSCLPPCEEKAEQAKKPAQAKSDAISNLVFLNKVENQLFFKVYFVGGESEVMTNRALSLKYPQEMIAFYEKHIKIEEETA